MKVMGMLLKVTEETKKIMLDYVKKEKAINLFIIGDVEQFGLDVDFLEVYLQYNEYKITACILRYYRNVIVYSDVTSFIVDEMMDLINSFQYNRLSGKQLVIDRLIPLLTRNHKVEICYFCALYDKSLLKEEVKNTRVARIEDIEKIIPLLKTVGFYHDTYQESTERKLKNNCGRIYYIQQDGLVTTSACTTIETSVSAMIGGVCTDINYRKQGLASHNVSKLCLDLINENKTPCLFFSNPDAGKIYHQLGFVDIGMWTMIKFED